MNPLEELPVMTIKARKIGGEMVDVLVDGDYDGEYFSTMRLRITPNGYVVYLIYDYTEELEKNGTVVATNPKHQYGYLHNLVLPKKEGYWTHFKNKNKLDCRSANLEYVTPTVNAMRRKQSTRIKPENKISSASTKYRGVQKQSNKDKTGRRYTSKNRYCVYIGGDYKGSYGSAEEAAIAYDKIARKKWGADAILNFPPVAGKNYCRVCYETVDQPHIYHMECLRKKRGET